MLPSDEILTKFTANSTSFGNLYSSHDSKCDYAGKTSCGCFPLFKAFYVTLKE